MEEIMIVGAIFIGLPWVVLHYVTKWKTAATLTSDDETLLEELYQLAKRLDERMDTVERLVASDNPAFQPERLTHGGGLGGELGRELHSQPLRELDRLLAERGERK
jgi:phage shock protein B